jgi:hypothetical protein
MVLDADRLARVEALARELAGGTSDFITLEFARAIARAELDLEQIRRLKAALVNTAASSRAIAKKPGEVPSDPLTGALAKVSSELAKIDRYERRALNRRDQAVRDLIAELSQGGPGE